MKTEKIFYERLDKVFDALRENNLKINDELFNRYVKFSRSYLDKVEDVVNTINTNKHLYILIDDDAIKIKVNNISFDSTYQFHEYTNDYVDVYRIKYENEFSELISSIELYQMFKNNAIKRKKGIIGINKENVYHLANSYQTISKQTI